MNVVKAEVVLSNIVKGIFFLKTEDGIIFCHQSNIRSNGLRFLLEGWKVFIHNTPSQETEVFVDDRLYQPYLNLEAPILKIFDEVAALKVNEEGRLYPLDIWGKRGVPQIECGKFKAYWLGRQHLRRFIVKMPASTNEKGFCLLDNEKNPRKEQEGLIENVSPGSYIVVAEKIETGFKIEIFCIGRRTQQDKYGEEISWLLIEKRFNHTYPLITTLEEVITNTPEPIPLKRNNKGFALGILRAIGNIAT